MSSLAGVKADPAGGEQAGSAPLPTSATGGSFAVMVKSKPLVLRAKDKEQKAAAAAGSGTTAKSAPPVLVRVLQE